MTFQIHTLGCKVNQNESGAISALLTDRGHHAVANEPDAILVNTCTVTAVSDKKCRSLLRRLRRDSPTAILAVCGCFAQVQLAEVQALQVADLIAGTTDRVAFADALEECFQNRKGPITVMVRAIETHETLESLPADTLGRTRAFLKIQDGCDNHCSYCIIPTARGPARSKPISALAAEASRLAKDGFREIILSGIEISAYRDGAQSVADLVAALANENPEVRFRLGSLEPTLIDAAFVQSVARWPNLCPHFHIALQSGCDKTLREMNRKYTTEDFRQALALLRKWIPHAAVTTDVITGFPGETDEDFAQTMDFIEECGFSRIHVFPYSERPGTKAAARGDHLPKSVRAERAKKIAQIGAKTALSFREKNIGQVLHVLWEQEKGLGHGENYEQVCVAQNVNRGHIDRVMITHIQGESLVGYII